MKYSAGKIYNYIYMTGKSTLLRNYVARLTAVFTPVKGRILPKFKYNYIKS